MLNILTLMTPRRLSGQHIAALTMIFSAACWGAGTVMSKGNLDYFPPLILLVVQLSASCAILWTAVLFSKPRVKLTWPAVRHGWIGILEPGLAYIFGMFGLAQTSATSASLISAIEPLLTIMLAWFLLREHFSRQMLALIGVALVGTLIVSLYGVEGQGQTLLGDVLVFGSIICASFYGVLSRESINHLPPIHMTAVQHTYGLLCAVAFLPIALLAGEANQLSNIPLDAWGVALLAGVVQYALAFLLYLMALKHITASQASLYLMLIPIFGICGGALFLGEQLSMIQVIGGVLILFALIRLRVGAPRSRPALVKVLSA
jgi:drug/metabolite transporter (DMT)-like permease